MNHQPFRSWLLSDEKLSSEQKQALQVHLNSCEYCSQVVTAWKEVELIIARVPQINPPTGFSQRWQENLVEYQRQQQSRKGWTTIGVTGFISICLLVVLATQIWSLVQAPGPYITIWLNRIVSVMSIYYLIQNAISNNSWSISIYTFIALFFLVGMISFMSVLWLAAVRKYSLARRVA